MCKFSTQKSKIYLNFIFLETSTMKTMQRKFKSQLKQVENTRTLWYNEKQQEFILINQMRCIWYICALRMEVKKCIYRWLELTYIQQIFPCGNLLHFHWNKKRHF